MIDIFIKKLKVILSTYALVQSLLQNIKFVPVGKPLLSRFPNRDRQAGICPGSGNRDKNDPFVPVGVTNRDKMVLFVLVWRSRLGNRDNRGFPNRTNLMLCSSDETHHADQMGLRFAWFEFKCNVYSKLSSLFFLKEKLLTYGNW